MRYTQCDHHTFKAAVTCYLCGGRRDSNMVRDHCHMTGHFLGAAHNSCNLNRQSRLGRWTIPVIAHNMKGFDSSFLIPALTEANIGRHGVRILAQNAEQFKSVSFGCFRLVDSLAFFSTSLDNLTRSLRDSNHAWPILRRSGLVKTRHRFDQSKFDLLLRKGVFPYE